MLDASEVSSKYGGLTWGQTTVCSSWDRVLQGRLSGSVADWDCSWDTDTKMETSVQEVQRLWKEKEGGGLRQGQVLGCIAALTKASSSSMAALRWNRPPELPHCWVGLGGGAIARSLCPAWTGHWVWPAPGRGWLSWAGKLLSWAYLSWGDNWGPLLAALPRSWGIVPAPGDTWAQAYSLLQESLGFR